MNNQFDQQFGFDPVPPSGTSISTGRGFSIASMVCGIVGVLMCCCCIYWFNLILGILAIVFAIISAKQSKAMRGMAIAGLILGIIAILIFIALFAFELWLLNLTEAEFNDLIGNAIKDTFGEDFYKEYMAEMGFDALK